MMRAVRFVSQLNFTIEQETLASLAKMPQLLEKIAVERKLAEFEKLLVGPSRKEAISILGQIGLSNYLPGLLGQSESLNKMVDYNLDELSLSEMWALLIQQIGLNEHEASKFLRQWKLPVKHIKHILKTLSWLRYRLERKWTSLSAYDAGKDFMLSAEKLVRSVKGLNPSTQVELVKLYDHLPIKSRSELNLTGSDLLSWLNKSPGPWINNCLRLVEEKVISGEVVNEKADIREWLINCNQTLEKD